MSVYVRAKVEVSSIILTIIPPTSKRIPERPTQIRVKKVHKKITFRYDYTLKQAGIF